MIGTVLQDKYRIEKKIGEGGFARVYRGTHLQLKRPVAIKMLITKPAETKSTKSEQPTQASQQEPLKDESS